MTDLHRVSKTVSTLSCYNFDVRESILTIFGKNVTEKVGNKRYVVFPPHLTSGSALPGEKGNPEIVSSHLSVACCFTKNTRNTLKYHVVTSELSSL